VASDENEARERTGLPGQERGRSQRERPALQRRGDARLATTSRPHTLQKARAHNPFDYSCYVNYILHYVSNYIVSAPTFLECGGLPPLLWLTQRRVMNGLKETMASPKRE